MLFSYMIILVLDIRLDFYIFLCVGLFFHIQWNVPDNDEYMPGIVHIDHSIQAASYYLGECCFRADFYTKSARNTCVGYPKMRFALNEFTETSID